MIKGSRKSMAVKLENFMPIPFCGCHIWMGSIDKDGYGTIRRPDGAHLKAHRESFRLHKFDPGDKQVLHTCDMEACINPDHLYLGDPRANGWDKRLRRRGRNSFSRPKGFSVTLWEEMNSKKSFSLNCPVISAQFVRNLDAVI